MFARTCHVNCKRIKFIQNTQISKARTATTRNTRYPKFWPIGLFWTPKSCEASRKGIVPDTL